MINLHSGLKGMVGKKDFCFEVIYISKPCCKQYFAKRLRVLAPPTPLHEKQQTQLTKNSLYSWPMRHWTCRTHWASLGWYFTISLGHTSFRELLNYFYQMAFQMTNDK